MFRNGLAILAVVLGVSGAARAAEPTLPECVHQLLGTDVSIKQAQELTSQWMARKGKDVKETLTNPWYNKNAERRHAEIWDVEGVPAHIKPVATKDFVFRHYATKETIEAIKRSRVLMSAYLPYVEAAPGVYKKNWNQITGAFLTTPGSSNKTVGVDSHGEVYYFLDLKVAEGVPVVELEKNHIYVIPLRKNVRPWVRELFMKFKAGETNISPTSLDMVRRIDAEGGVDPYVGAVPIEIVSEGRAQ